MFYPIVALVNILVYTLKNPAAPTAISDVALLEVIAGQFSYLEFASTGAITIPSTRTLAREVRVFVEQALRANTPQEMLGAAGAARAAIVRTSSAVDITDLWMEEVRSSTLWYRPANDYSSVRQRFKCLKFQRGVPRELVGYVITVARSVIGAVVSLDAQR